MTTKKIKEYDAATTACAYTSGGLATAGSAALMAGLPTGVAGFAYFFASIAATVGYYFNRERRQQQDNLSETRISELEGKLL